MAFSKTILIDTIRSLTSPAQAVDFPDGLSAVRLDAATGVLGIVADLGGTQVTTAGHLNMATGTTITLGVGTTGLSAGGGDLVVNGTTGEVLFGDEASHLMRAHGVPKIRKFTVGYSSFSVAALSGSASFTVDSDFDWVPLDCFIRRSQAWVGTGITALDLQIGEQGGSVGTLITTGRIDLVATTPVLDGFDAADRGSAVSTHGTLKSNAGAFNSINVVLTATGANLDQLTQGTIDVYLRYFTLPPA